jgi:hypothetical protein
MGKRTNEEGKINSKNESCKEHVIIGGEGDISVGYWSKI